jgi:hypothetical protein
MDIDKRYLEVMKNAENLPQGDTKTDEFVGAIQVAYEIYKAEPNEFKEIIVQLLDEFEAALGLTMLQFSPEEEEEAAEILKRFRS